jgi:hypothetical protein
MLTIYTKEILHELIKLIYFWLGFLSIILTYFPPLRDYHIPLLFGWIVVLISFFHAGFNIYRRHVYSIPLEQLICELEHNETELIHMKAISASVLHIDIWESYKDKMSILPSNLTYELSKVYMNIKGAKDILSKITQLAPGLDIKPEQDKYYELLEKIKKGLPNIIITLRDYSGKLKNKI